MHVWTLRIWFSHKELSAAALIWFQHKWLSSSQIMHVWTSFCYGFRSESQLLAQPCPWPCPSSSCGSDSNARLSLSRCSILQLKQICLQKRSQKWFCKCRNLKLEYFCASPIYNAAHKPVRHSYGALMSSLFIDEFRFLNIESLSLSLDVFLRKVP